MLKITTFFVSNAFLLNKVFLKISKISLENTCVGVSLACNVIKKRL